jgi:hypothetical protein
MVVGATTGILPALRTVTEAVSGASSSAAAALFLAVAFDKRTAGIPESQTGRICKSETSHTGTRLAVEAMPLYECADLISLTSGSFVVCTPGTREGQK